MAALTAGVLDRSREGIKVMGTVDGARRGGQGSTTMQRQCPMISKPRYLICIMGLGFSSSRSGGAISQSASGEYESSSSLSRRVERRGLSSSSSPKPSSVSVAFPFPLFLGRFLGCAEEPLVFRFWALGIGGFVAVVYVRVYDLIDE